MDEIQLNIYCTQVQVSMYILYHR